MEVRLQSGLRLYVGCGKRRLPGYLGIDIEHRAAADIVAPADRIPLQDGCAKEVLAVHLIEHLIPWEVPQTLAEWARLLAPGGLLVIEAPDLMKCCRNILEGRQGKKPNQLGLWGLYGQDTLRDERMLHKWAYTFGTLAPLVREAGFVDIVEKETAFHATGRGVRDFRLEAARR